MKTRDFVSASTRGLTFMLGGISIFFLTLIIYVGQPTGIFRVHQGFHAYIEIGLLDTLAGLFMLWGLRIFYHMCCSTFRRKEDVKI